jgi:predicted RNA-binding Zn-ribbon protein involved in translation (DUF1610 family)
MLKSFKRSTHECRPCGIGVAFKTDPVELRCSSCGRPLTRISTEEQQRRDGEADRAMRMKGTPYLSVA